MKRYDPKTIEAKWQKIWDETGIYKTPEHPGENKYYCLVMFPYPSGDLHSGHWYNFGPGDAVARFHRMQGKNVLHPIGFDAFGLPAENAAIKRHIPPAQWTDQNIASMTKQLKALGAMYDWDRLVDTSKPEYYRWTQWLFLNLYKQGLAYRAKGWQNWCPSCQTVLANEQVVGENNVCERCGTPVVKKELEQWFFKITDYADRLLTDLDKVVWPERVKVMQQNWIGRSEGAVIRFMLDESKESIGVFTTRPDTLFGATYMVLAPEHPLVDKITTQDQTAEVQNYQTRTSRETELDRMEATKQKTGVFTGAYAINPANNEKLPIWIADYVLMSYGTGAIMAVPAHDERDHEFARKFKLPIKSVVEPVTGEPQTNPEFRRSVVALVRNPKTQEILTINWGEQQGGRLLIGGGRDGAEDPVDAAQREVAEETGYHNLKLVGQTEHIHHHYFAHSKNKAREIEAIGLYFELAGQDRHDVRHEADEKGKFEVEWVSQDQAKAEIGDELHQYVLEKFLFDRVYTGTGPLVDSGEFNGLSGAKAQRSIVEHIFKLGLGHGHTQFRLRDWLISRQRYWGAPIPVVYCDKCGIVPVPEDQLPVKLPLDVEFEPTGESPLAKLPEFYETTCPQCAGPGLRETDTMDTFVDSSWYFLRYPNNQYDQGPFDPAAVKEWAPVDQYMGGIEHAILHLLYSRFITKVLFDQKLIEFDEPFRRLFNQGIILGTDGQKMSKSRGNVVSPDEQVEAYSADTFRVYLMFMGPYDQGGPFSLQGMGGVSRFLQRVWQLVQDYAADKGKAERRGNAALETALLTTSHKTIRKVTVDIESFGFNTTVAALMEHVNQLYKLKVELPFDAAPEAWRTALATLVQLLAPLAPHITEELWERLGGKGSVHVSPWPRYDESLIREELMELPVQVNGKLRAVITLPTDADEVAVVQAAQFQEAVAKYLEGKKIGKTVYVPHKLINFVTKSPD